MEKSVFTIFIHIFFCMSKIVDHNIMPLTNSNLFQTDKKGHNNNIIYFSLCIYFIHAYRLYLHFEPLNNTNRFQLITKHKNFCFDLCIQISPQQVCFYDIFTYFFCMSKIVDLDFTPLTNKNRFHADDKRHDNAKFRQLFPTWKQFVAVVADGKSKL